MTKKKLKSGGAEEPCELVADQAPKKKEEKKTKKRGKKEEPKNL
jgi:hypothetical protein